MQNEKVLQFIKKNWKVITISVVGIMFVLMLIIVVLFLALISNVNGRRNRQEQQYSTTQEITEVQMAFSPISSVDSLEDVYYDEVVSRFREAGFTNVVTVATDDLLTKDLDKANRIESIIIDGKDTFDVNDEFLQNVKVVIKYYTINEVEVPLSSNDVTSYNYKEVAKKFEDAGFVNIKYEQVEDLVFGWLTSDGDIEEVIIDGESVFASGEKHIADVSVIIKYHTFPEDDTQDDTTNSKTPKKKESTTEKQTNPTTETRTLQDGEIQIPRTASYYRNMNYEEVVKEFEKLGFIDVKTEGLYDLNTGFWDSLSLYEVEHVSVKNNKEFQANDIFMKDDEIIILYHDYELNDPDIEYETYSVSTLMSELESNPLKSKENYMEKYVEITGRIDVIDSNGQYISLFPADNEWALTGVKCDILLEEQKEKVLEMSKGNIITLKGKITYVDEVFGYSLDIYHIE